MMSDSTIVTATGDVIEGAAVDAFRTGLRGQLLQPGDDAYDTARKLWNGMFDRRPALIARLCRRRRCHQIGECCARSWVARRGARWRP
jgi:hypothetical protein